MCYSGGRDQEAIADTSILVAPGLHCGSGRACAHPMGLAAMAPVVPRETKATRIRRGEGV